MQAPEQPVDTFGWCRFPGGVWYLQDVMVRLTHLRCSMSQYLFSAHHCCSTVLGNHTQAQNVKRTHPLPLVQLSTETRYANFATRTSVVQYAPTRSSAASHTHRASTRLLPALCETNTPPQPVPPARGHATAEQPGIWTACFQNEANLRSTQCHPTRPSVPRHRYGPFSKRTH